LQTERDGSEGSIVLYIDGMTFTYDEIGAEYDEGEELDEAGVAAFVEARRRAEERAEQRRAEIERRRQESIAAEYERMTNEVSTMDVHPYLRDRAKARLFAVVLHHHGDIEAKANAVDAAKKILAGDIGFSVQLNGKTWALWSNNIGGAKVDHLREGGRIAASEGERLWDEVAKKHYTEGRTFMRPSELLDALQAEVKS
jgi:hypothetical protein